MADVNADAVAGNLPQLVLRQPGLLIHAGNPMFCATRDIEVDFAGRYGIIEVKSYAKWINTQPLPARFRGQVLLQL